MILGIPTQVARANPAPGADAHPSTGTYTATLGGTASWDGANTTTITAPNGSIFDWQNFDIGSNQSVVHVQGATDAVLHRINVTTGYGDTFATGINGDLSAPGYLFVVNPMGIVIGADALISANRFVASGLNISNFSDYINGVTNELQFDGYSTGTLGVVNYSDNVNATELVALIGKTVLNNGTITSGSVVLAAGDRVYLSVTGSGSNLVVDVTDLSTPTPADNTVDNSGTISATDNLLLAAGDIYSNAISGVANLAAEANRDIIIDNDIEAGEIAMEAGRNISLGGVVEATGSGDVSLTTTTGDVTVADVRALDDQITINSGGAIDNEGAVDGTANAVGGVINLTANSGGIGQTNTLEVTASTELNADTTADNSNINILSIGDLPVGLVDAGTGDVDLTSTGNIMGVTDDDTADVAGGTISLLAASGGIGDALDVTATTALNANTASDGSNINIDSIGDLPVGLVVAGSGDVTLESDSAIRDAVDDSGSPVVDVAGATINLTAASGGIGTPSGADGVLELAATTELNADTTADNSNINILNIGDLPVGLVDAGTGDVDLLSTGNIMGVTDDDTADVAGGTISLLAASGGIGDALDVTATTALNANTASDGSNINIDSIGDLPVGLVVAGSGDVTLESDSAIRDAVDDSGSPVVDVVGATINLTAASGGIGTPSGADGVLEVAATTELNADTVTGDDSDILIDSVIDLPVGLVDAGTGDVTLNSTGNIMSVIDDAVADVAGSTINLTANIGGIGNALDVTALTALNADSTADNSDIVIDSIGDLPVGLVDAGTGNVTLISTGNIMGVTDDDIADVVGSTINLTAVSGGIGNALDVTALTALNADSTADNSDIVIDSIGDLPVGLVNAGTGDVALDSTDAINDASDDTDVDVVSNMLTLTADDEIGGNPAAGKETDKLGALETTVASLDAQSDVSGDIVIVETDDVDLYDVIATSGSIYLEATQGGMTHIDGTIEAGSSTLTLVQQDDLDLAGFTFANQANTDLMVEITEGGFTTVDTANGGNDDNAADQWQSIQARATNNIVLQGSDADEDIKIGTHAGYEPLSHPFGGVVESSEGGVSIVSENKTVRTAGDTILDNVSIAGTSDDDLDVGVDLPYGPGKAAIVIMGAEALNLGENTTLAATGTYDTTGDVDDREGVGFLDVRDEIPFGFPRYEGDPFDAAIYLASTEEDVDVSSTVSILSSKIVDDVKVDKNEGAMVIDAYDTVTFDESGTSSAFEDSLKDGMVGNRLEVASRITEWLFQAVGHLPYPSYPYDGAGPFPLGYTYVLRGAGLDNPAITDGRAWVLVDPDNAPLDEEEGEKAQKQILGLDGCPILIGLVSAELGIPEETIEVSLENSYALNTDVQPCESCARLIDAAAILRDEDGSRMAAMNQVFNALAPSDAPLTPEVTASIVSTFAGHINDGTQYATAIEYIDAFVQYIAVLNNDIGSPVGDSVAYVIEKYGKGVTENENKNMAAFLAVRLENGEILGN